MKNSAPVFPASGIAFLRALKGPSGIYNIGTGVETTTIGVYRMVRKLVGFGKDATHGPPVHGEVDRNALNCALARKKLKWAPRMKLEEGLGRLVQFMGIGAGPA